VAHEARSQLATIATLGRRILARRWAPALRRSVPLGHVVAARHQPVLFEASTRLARGRALGRKARAERDRLPGFAVPPGMSEFAARWIFGQGPAEGIPFAGGAAIGSEQVGAPTFLRRAQDEAMSEPAAPPGRAQRPATRAPIEEFGVFRLSRRLVHSTEEESASVDRTPDPSADASPLELDLALEGKRPVGDEQRIGLETSQPVRVEDGHPEVHDAEASQRRRRDLEIPEPARPVVAVARRAGAAVVTPHTDRPVVSMHRVQRESQVSLPGRPSPPRDADAVGRISSLPGRHGPLRRFLDRWFGDRHGQPDAEVPAEPPPFQSDQSRPASPLESVPIEPAPVEPFGAPRPIGVGETDAAPVAVVRTAPAGGWLGRTTASRSRTRREQAQTVRLQADRSLARVAGRLLRSRPRPTPDHPSTSPPQERASADRLGSNEVLGETTTARPTSEDSATGSPEVASPGWVSTEVQTPTGNRPSGEVHAKLARSHEPTEIVRATGVPSMLRTSQHTLGEPDRDLRSAPSLVRSSSSDRPRRVIPPMSPTHPPSGYAEPGADGAPPARPLLRLERRTQLSQLADMTPPNGWGATARSLGSAIGGTLARLPAETATVNFPLSPSPSAPLSLAHVEGLARQASDASAPVAAPVPAVPPASALPAPSPGAPAHVDVDELYGQLVERMQRELLIERERRGEPLWD
jgi:hypothetical protein